MGQYKTQELKTESEYVKEKHKKEAKNLNNPQKYDYF